MSPLPNPTEDVRNFLRDRVPSVANGDVGIEAVERDLGQGAMIAVSSRSPALDSIGACVGPRGVIIKELVRHWGGERIDLIRWKDTSEQLIKAAFHPEAISQVEISAELRRAVVVASLNPDFAYQFDPHRLVLLSRLSGYQIELAAAGPA